MKVYEYLHSRKTDIELKCTRETDKKGGVNFEYISVK
nr:MAG TPA: hypothetical protein [Caudoviricetes sp.]